MFNVPQSAGLFNYGKRTGKKQRQGAKAELSASLTIARLFVDLSRALWSMSLVH